MHLLCANYWIESIYQELLHAAPRHNASVHGERKRPCSGLAKVIAHQGKAWRQMEPWWRWTSPQRRQRSSRCSWSCFGKQKLPEVATRRQVLKRGRTNMAAFSQEGKGRSEDSLSGDAPIWPLSRKGMRSLQYVLQECWRDWTWFVKHAKTQVQTEHTARVSDWISWSNVSKTTGSNISSVLPLAQQVEDTGNPFTEM